MKLDDRLGHFAVGDVVEDVMAGPGEFGDA